MHAFCVRATRRPIQGPNEMGYTGCHYRYCTGYLYIALLIVTPSFFYHKIISYIIILIIQEHHNTAILEKNRDNGIYHLDNKHLILGYLLKKFYLINFI